MLNQNDKIELFSQEINKNADKIVKKLEKQTERFRKQQLDSFEADARAQLDHRIAYESHRLETEMNREISALRAERKRAVLDHRAAIVDSVFEEAKARLVSFRDTPAYDALLEKVMRDLSSRFSGEVVFFVAPADESAAAKIAQSISNCAGVKTDDSITLGLAKAADPDFRVVVDDTMECRLAQYRETFLEESNLQIEEKDEL